MTKKPTNEELANLAISNHDEELCPHDATRLFELSDVCLAYELAKRLKEHVHALRRETLHKVELVNLLQRIAATDAVANWGDEDLYEDLMTTIGQHNAGAGGGVE